MKLFSIEREGLPPHSWVRKFSPKLLRVDQVVWKIWPPTFNLMTSCLLSPSLGERSIKPLRTDQTGCFWLQWNESEKKSSHQFYYMLQISILLSNVNSKRFFFLYLTFETFVFFALFELFFFSSSWSKKHGLFLGLVKTLNQSNNQLLFAQLNNELLFYILIKERNKKMEF